MEQEIPEVFDGTVEIMSVSREAGDHTKVAVRSHNPNVDAIGTIVGRGGSNIKKDVYKRQLRNRRLSVGWFSVFFRNKAFWKDFNAFFCFLINVGEMCIRDSL